MSRTDRRTDRQADKIFAASNVRCNSVARLEMTQIGLAALCIMIVICYNIAVSILFAVRVNYLTT